MFARPGPVRNSNRHPEWALDYTGPHLSLFFFHRNRNPWDGKVLACGMIYYSVFAGVSFLLSPQQKSMRWEGACLLHDLLLSLCRIGTFHLNICNHTQVVPGALYLECRNLYCTNQDILFTTLEVAEDWFILVRSAHPAAVEFKIICLENPSELKSKFQNKLLSFSSASWLHASWEVQRFFCLNASLNLVFITMLWEQVPREFFQWQQPVFDLMMLRWAFSFIWFMLTTSRLIKRSQNSLIIVGLQLWRSEKSRKGKCLLIQPAENWEEPGSGLHPTQWGRPLGKHPHGLDFLRWKCWVAPVSWSMQHMYPFQSILHDDHCYHIHLTEQYES